MRTYLCDILVRRKNLYDDLRPFETRSSDTDRKPAPIGCVMAKWLSENQVIERLQEARSILGDERCRDTAADTALKGARLVLNKFALALMYRQESRARANDPPAP